MNLTAASRQRIQSGATLLTDRLCLRRRSRQRNAITKALAHEAVGGFLCRERSVDLIEQSAVLVRSRDGAAGEGGNPLGRIAVGAIDESVGRNRGSDAPQALHIVLGSDGHCVPRHIGPHRKGGQQCERGGAQPDSGPRGEKAARRMRDQRRTSQDEKGRESRRVEEYPQERQARTHR